MAHSWSLLIWLVNKGILKTRGRGGLGFMTRISITGVAIGVAALIIVLSVMAGFENDLQQKMLRGTPHLEIEAENALAGFALRDHPLKQLKKALPGVAGIEPYVQADVVLKNKQHLASAVLFGIQPEGGKLWGFKGQLIEGDLAAIGDQHQPLGEGEAAVNRWPGITLGDQLAYQIGVGIGEEVLVVSPTAALKSSQGFGSTLTRRYVVSGIFHTGLFNYDTKWAVVDLAEGRRFLQDYDPTLERDRFVSGIGVNVADPFEIQTVASKVEQLWPHLRPRTWQETNGSLLLALKLEKFTMGSILMLIVLVAAFSISGTMMMSVYHKKVQISLLRAMGMSARGVMRVYLLQALLIATIGVAIGLLFGLGVCWGLTLLQGVDLPHSLSALRIFPVRFLPLEYVTICLFAWLLTLVGASYPAWMAAKQQPSMSLRY